MREISVAEQRYEAVRAVLADGETVTDVAARFGVTRKTVHHWLRKYEAGGIEELGDRSHRPRSCPHQMSAERVEPINRHRTVTPQPNVHSPTRMLCGHG
jgi:transposase